MIGLFPWYYIAVEKRGHSEENVTGAYEGVCLRGKWPIPVGLAPDGFGGLHWLYKL